LDRSVAEQFRPAAIEPRRRMILMAALMATFMPAVESAIVATALPTIIGDLGGFHLLSWVFAVPLLTMAVTIPLYGRLADLYGRKRIFFIGTGIFLVGTTLCGFARSTELLIVFRAIQGCGSGAIQPIAVTILGDIYTPAERAKIQGLTSSVFGVAAIVGPASAAFLVEQVHWSLVFWVNLPFGIAAIIMFAVFLDESVERRRHRIDYLGGVLLVIGIGCLMFALVRAPTLTATEIGGLTAVGLAALVWLLRHESRVSEPMLPLHLWQRRILALSNFAGFGASATMMGVTMLLPAYVQAVMGHSPSVAAFVVGATSVSWMFAALLAGRVMIRTSYRHTARIGGAALLAGSLVLLSIHPTISILWPITGAFLLGIAMGFLNTTFLVAIQASVGRNERGIATGSQMFMRMIGQAVGAALLGAILNFGVHRRLPEAATDAVNQLLRPGPRQTLSTVDIAQLADAVAVSAHEAYFLVVLIAAVTLILTLCFPAGLRPTHEPER
jgi:EmrB/QacA subfamily drug resistance transporter